jgi:hypothetical protein
MNQQKRAFTGSFYTPQIWVELSQQYLTDLLGENWQDEYYIWDCAAGTGNLLNGLTNKHHIWASTLDKQDVDMIHDCIKNGANLLEAHVFQFDFLNDDFTRLPYSLQSIINDPEKRKKLVMYINPPYAEATTAQTATGTGENKVGVAKSHKLSEQYKPKLGSAVNEIFALFMARIYDQISACILAQFSTLKFVQGSNFGTFKNFFKAQFLGGFVVPANTFYNVNGSFVIGFTVWNLVQKKDLEQISCEVYSKVGQHIGTKNFYGNLQHSINQWLAGFYIAVPNNCIGMLSTRGNDFQNQKFIYIATKIDNNTHDTKVSISPRNLIPLAIYFAVRHCIEATWLNDRDQFLLPKGGWQTDSEFQNNCLTFLLFHTQNKISSHNGINHWIPFTEQEIEANGTFDSNFMTHFLKGKIPYDNGSDMFSPAPNAVAYYQQLSQEAELVFEAGRNLWKYYHSTIKNDNTLQKSGSINASLYDIRVYFQGRNDKGKMNSKSEDETYMLLLATLREALRILAQKIEPKVYEYAFLRT